MYGGGIKGGSGVKKVIHRRGLDSIHRIAIIVLRSKAIIRI
jgi:hypothetical protein